MKHNFEERRQHRLDHAHEQAEKNEKLSDDLYNQAKSMAAAIPFGQPILIGHHSERSDRAYRERIHNTLGKAFATQEKADYYERKAATIENNTAIFSDDPEAIQKLKADLQHLKDEHAFIKAANPLIKKGDKETFLTLPLATEAMWTELTTPGYTGKIGFASYALSYKRAEIRRVEDRIALLEKMANRPTSETVINGVTLVENVEANRVQLKFPGIPSEEVRQKLKSHGFRWCRTESAWQRHLTPWAIHIARGILNSL